MQTHHDLYIFKSGMGNMPLHKNINERPSTTANRRWQQSLLNLLI
jgi:hypothetical protein